MKKPPRKSTRRAPTKTPIAPPATAPAPPPPPSAPPAAPRRRIAAKHSAFIAQFAAQSFQDPDRAAKLTGFTRAGIGYKLASRLSDLIEAERIRRSLADQMEIDEALRLLAELARTTINAKTQHAALRTILQVHGVLSDKPMPPADRRKFAEEVQGLLIAIKGKIERSGARADVVRDVMGGALGGGSALGGVPSGTLGIVDITPTVVE